MKRKAFVILRNMILAVSFIFFLSLGSGFMAASEEERTSNGILVSTQERTELLFVQTSSEFPFSVERINKTYENNQGNLWFNLSIIGNENQSCFKPLQGMVRINNTLDSDWVSSVSYFGWDGEDRTSEFTKDTSKHWEWKPSTVKDCGEWALSNIILDMDELQTSKSFSYSWGTGSTIITINQSDSFGVQVTDAGDWFNYTGHIDGGNSRGTISTAIVAGNMTSNFLNAPYSSFFGIRESGGDYVTSVFGAVADTDNFMKEYDNNDVRYCVNSTDSGNNNVQKVDCHYVGAIADTYKTLRGFTDGTGWQNENQLDENYWEAMKCGGITQVGIPSPSFAFIDVTDGYCAFWEDIDEWGMCYAWDTRGDAVDDILYNLQVGEEGQVKIGNTDQFNPSNSTVHHWTYKINTSLAEIPAYENPCFKRYNYTIILPMVATIHIGNKTISIECPSGRYDGCGYDFQEFIVDLKTPVNFTNLYRINESELGNSTWAMNDTENGVTLIIHIGQATNINAGESLILSYETPVQDITAPTVTNPEYVPANNSAYSHETEYKFNITVEDDSGVGEVILYFNGVNRTNTSGTAGEYEFNVGGLAVGTYGNNIYYSNDSVGNGVVNDTGMYTVTKAVGSITITSNTTATNMTESILVNCNTPSEDGGDDISVTLQRNGTVQANNTIFKPVVQASYNFTCFQTAGENYTAATDSQVVNVEIYLFVDLFDEETNLPFATNETNGTTIEVFCEERTLLENVNGSNHTIKVDCSPKFVRIEVDFGGDKHFRDQIQTQNFGNMRFYMVNETNKPQPSDLLEINFLLNDLTGQFEGSTLKLKKAINGTFETINSQNFDAEGKVVAFLIKNDLYRITVDNGIEERVIGNGDLFATSAGDKNINVDRINFATNVTSIYNELNYNITTVNISSSGFPLIRLTYNDSTNGTNGIIFQILNSSSFDKVLYQNISNLSNAIFDWSNSSINVNATYVGKVIIDHSVFGEVEEIFYITFWQPGLDKLPLDISNFWRGIIASLLVIVVALSFGRAYKEVGLLFTTGTIFFLSLIGWLPFNRGTVVLFMFAAVIYVVSSRRRVN